MLASSRTITYTPSAELPSHPPSVRCVVCGQPIEIYVDDESKLTLHGLQQYYVKLSEAQKNRKLNDLLDALDFNQVVIFVNGVRRAKELNKLLNECNFPSMAIYGGLEQEERLERYNKFKVHTHTHTHPIITCAPKRKGGDITAYFPAAQRQRVVTHSVTRQGQGPPAQPPPPPPPGRGPPPPPAPSAPPAPGPPSQVWISSAFAYGTTLRLYNGDTVLVQHLVGGEMLMGPDSRPRVVTAGSVIHGVARMFTLRPGPNSGADPFTVTGDRRIALVNHKRPILLDKGKGARPWRLARWDVTPPRENKMRTFTTSFFTEREGEDIAVLRVPPALPGLYYWLGAWGPLWWDVSLDQYYGEWWRG